jgi:hypothetical protein
MSYPKGRLEPIMFRSILDLLRASGEDVVNGDMIVLQPFHKSWLLFLVAYIVGVRKHDFERLPFVLAKRHNC